MSANVITRISRFAAALLLFAATAAPLWALIPACSMPCCEGMQPAQGAGCAEQCGISSNTASHELPSAVAPSSENTKISLAALAMDETSSAPVLAPRPPAFSAAPPHAVPGDAPVYLYNSVFLI